MRDENGWKPKMTLTFRHGKISSCETINDDEFLRQLVDILEYLPMSTAELFEHAFKCWLKSPEGVRIAAIIQSKREIARGDIHDFDDVLEELEAILRGDDPGAED